MMDIVTFLKEKHNINLNEQQQQGIFANMQNTLLLAVPGSGKTTVLVSRIANLMINENISCNKILTLTYSKETARDMKKRYFELFGEISNKTPMFKTIHSFCLSVMKYYAKKYHRKIPALIDAKINNGLKQKILREIYKHYNSDYLTEDNYELLERLISFTKNMMISKNELQTKKYEIANFNKIYEDYETYKKKNGLMDFDDMLSITLDIFEKFNDILTAFQKQYSYINIDEAQDTSLLQHRIIELLSKHSRIFMVGDEDQTIYSFRGAYPNGLLEFEKIYKNPLIIKMEQNYRSNGDIILTANKFILQNKNRYQKNMYCDNQNTNSIHLIKLNDYYEQYHETFKLIKSMAKDISVGILYKNNESAIPMIDLFYKHNIDFYMKDHKISYFSSSVIRDIICFFRLAIDAKDIDAFSIIYYKLGYSKGEFDFVSNRFDDYDSVFDCILDITSLSEYKKNKTKKYIRFFPRMLRMSPYVAIESIQTDLNYDNYIENGYDDGFTKTNTYQKLNSAKQLAKGEKNIYDFLDKLEELQENMENKKNINTKSNITLSTLHSSKGLEFDVVILLDMIKDIIPSSDSILDKKMAKYDDYENEVRLFYVGMTRAKSQLVMFQSHLLNSAIASPSQFINQIF